MHKEHFAYVDLIHVKGDFTVELFKSNLRLQIQFLHGLYCQSPFYFGAFVKVFELVLLLLWMFSVKGLLAVASSFYICHNFQSPCWIKLLKMIYHTFVAIPWISMARLFQKFLNRHFKSISSIDANVSSKALVNNVQFVVTLALGNFKETQISISKLTFALLFFLSLL
jgi:hypothetical protein